jgi:hypothetical protein
MTRLIATTVVRESVRGKQRTGYIYDVDWDSRTVLHTFPVPEPAFPESDQNPRGGVRGGRGVAVTPMGVAVANYDTISIYDDDWRLVSSISHPLCVGIHEVEWDGTHLWAAATGIDVILRITTAGEVEAAWDPHQNHLRELLGLRPRPHPVDGSIDYRRRQAPLFDQCHINGVTRRDDATIVNCGLIRPSSKAAARFATRALRRGRRFLHLSKPSNAKGRPVGRSLVARVPDGDEPADVLLELEAHDFPTHNGQLIDEDLLAVNDSTHNTLRIFDVTRGEQVLSVEMPGTWLRGLEPVDRRRVFVGSAPARIMLVDLEERRPVGEVELSQDPLEAVHGLVLYDNEESR